MGWETTTYEARCMKCGAKGACVESSNDWGGSKTSWVGFKNVAPDPTDVVRKRASSKDMVPVCKCGSRRITIILEKQQDKTMDDSTWQKREPWVVVDPDFKREWLLPQPLQYYLVEDKATGTWSVCDRYLDIPAFYPAARTREQAIRRFYKMFKRPIPTGHKLGKFTDRKAGK
jgi:hypothetical protein